MSSSDFIKLCQILILICLLWIHSFEWRVTNTQILVEILKLWHFQGQRSSFWTFNSYVLPSISRWHAGGNGGKKYESSIPDLGDFRYKPWNKMVFCVTLKGTRKKANYATLSPNWHRFLWNVFNDLLNKCRVTCFLEFVFNQFLRKFLE